MKHTIIALGCALLSFAGARAAETAAEPDAASRRDKMLKATGGILDIAAKGKVVIVNAQDRIAASVLSGRV